MLRKQLPRFARVFLIAFVLMIGIAAGSLMDRQSFVAQAQAPAPTAAPTTTAEGAPDFKLITEAWNQIQKAYVDRSALQTTPLTYGAISGMVSSLGDTGHSTFMSPEMVKSENSYTQGSFEGIGAQVESKDGHVEIVAPFDGSPAQKAGLGAGDAIMKVDGVDVSGLPLEQVVSKILGPAGTQVTLTILHTKTGKMQDYTLTRAKINMQNVTWQIIPGTKVAHLRLAGFSQGVSRELRQALTDMQQQGVTAVILDLRNNPGGLLNEAVSTASQFLSSGDVLLEKDAKGNVSHLSVRSGGAATGMPMVVLVNNGTASASEIVAGAIQDAHRGVVIGDTTFGTGTVLTQFPLSDGSALMLAIQEWLTPSGRVIWHKGIVPDQQIAMPDGTSPLTPEGERSMTADQFKASGDAQLLKGLALLTQSAVAPQSMGTLATASTPVDISSQVWALELSLLQYANI